MKNIPIRIASPDLEFVIVGPMSREDGILVSSNNLSIDLIGFANSVYSKSEFIRSHKFIHSKDSHYYFAWSGEMINSNYTNNQTIESRPFQILYCWKSVGNNLRPLNIDKQNEVSNLFIKTGFDIYNLLGNNKMNINELHNAVIWKISPLIFLSL